MNAQTIRRAYAGIVVGYVIVIAAAILARDYWRERARVRGVVDDTIAELTERAEEVRSRIPGMLAEEGLPLDPTETVDA